MAKIQTRARAVDMLGRQQIAGIQNALSEIFKNAYDAYANAVAVDYFESPGSDNRGFLVIRDDGIGMTLEDFENKWLVLGTESKLNQSPSEQFKPASMISRPVTGEKGIGRLAIALLGEQVLILTRAIREDGLSDLVVALVHWGLFEIPGLNLEDIDIPVQTFDSGILPNTKDVALLRDKLLACLERIQLKRGNHSALNKIKKDIESFTPDPTNFDEFFSARDEKKLSLKGDGTGTHFYIGPSNPVIKVELDVEAKTADYSFRKQLLGFYDVTFGGGSQQSHNSIQNQTFQTSFRRWMPGDLFGEEILAQDTFFSTEELEKADHLLSGTIDDYGQFKGSLRVYDQNYEDVIIPWQGSQGRQTLCGEFNIRFGYVHGRGSESKVPPEEFFTLNEKLEKLGGMYVYRDNIRILPYGDHSNDWLEVEKRRNKGAGYYFFSFRRMFGAVLLTRKHNENLHEKAGREGFQQNEAYRQFRDILQNLLIQLAAEFFRKGGANTELFERTQTDIRKRSEALERQQKRASEKRKLFANNLAKFANESAAGLPESSIATIRKLTQSRMESASLIEDQDKAAGALIRAEQDATLQLNNLRQKYLVKKPAGIALTKDLSREWDGYLLERERLETQVFAPFEDEISKSLGEIANQARIYIDQRKRLEEKIKILAEDRKKQLAEAAKQANESASDTRKTVFDITQKARLALDNTIQNIQVDLNKTDLNLLGPERVEELRKKWEEQLSDIEVRHRDALMAARDMLSALAENLKASDGEEPAQILEALEHRMLALEDQADEDFEMVQLGLAVAIINHEFSASISKVRNSVQELGQLSRKANELKPLYEKIRTNFEHLDGHLNLFTPLQKRLYRIPQAISGKSIRNYINDLFASRFDRHQIVLECTDAFLENQISCYPSTLYPAFINIVDNAMFWLSSQNGEKIIQLDADGQGFVISNNGPAIETRDYLRIFERGYSRKSGGRGLGLFISHRALQAENMALSVQEPSGEFNVSFRITKPHESLS